MIIKYSSKHKFTTILMAFNVLILCSCSLNYAGKKNLNENRFSDYFAPSNVQIIDNEKMLPKQHQLLGIVEGQDCQEKPHLAAPDPINARTDARRKANKLGANVIIFNQCITIPDQQCHRLLVCYGNAYKVSHEQ